MHVSALITRSGQTYACTKKRYPSTRSQPIVLKHAFNSRDYAALFDCPQRSNSECNCSGPSHTLTVTGYSANFLLHVTGARQQKMVVRRGRAFFKWYSKSEPPFSEPHHTSISQPEPSVVQVVAPVWPHDGVKLDRIVPHPTKAQHLPLVYSR
jgi:hypothetical protein